MKMARKSKRGKTFNSMSALLAHIEQDVLKALDTSEEEIKKVLQKNVMDTVYSRPVGNIYERTGELFKCIRTSKEYSGSSGLEREVKFDKNATSHTSIIGSHQLGISQDERVYIPQWVNDGWTWRSDSLGGGYYPAPQFYEKSLNELQKGKKHVKAFKQDMRSRGYDIR